MQRENILKKVAILGLMGGCAALILVAGVMGQKPGSFNLNRVMEATLGSKH